MPSKQAHRAVAAQQGRQAGQRELAGRETGQVEADDPLSTYLQSLVPYASAALERKRCLWCGKTSGVKRGMLPIVGDLYYCPLCRQTYMTAKLRQNLLDEEEDMPELKVHLADGWGESSCGVGHIVSKSMKKVTCKRCLNFYGASGVPVSVRSWLKKLAKA